MMCSIILAMVIFFLFGPLATLTYSSPIAYYKDLHERAKYAPYRIEPILVIIEEEAGDYWDGSKSKEEVTSIIQSRVNILINE